MNATSLYASTCRLIMLADVADKSSWSDLFRLVPYLRQSLSCRVCANLLQEPYTPTASVCQHHVCKDCLGGKKKLKPSCSWCKDYEQYAENLTLRTLLQCYKHMCEYFIGTDVYKSLLEEDEIAAGVNGGTVASSGLIDLIQEGAGFSDDYKSTAGLSKSAYSILPCVYTNSTSTQTQAAASSSNTDGRVLNIKDSPSNRPTSNGSPLYSVMYAGTGNKITIKRKAVDDAETPHESTSRDSKEIQRFESVHPSIYALYDLVELVPDPLLAQQIRDHVVAIEDLSDEFGGFDSFPFDDIPPEFRDHFPAHFRRAPPPAAQPPHAPAPAPAPPAPHQTTSTQTEQHTPGPSTLDPQGIPQYGLRNTVDLGQKSPVDPVVDAEERSHRSMSAPPESRNNMSGQSPPQAEQPPPPPPQAEHGSNVRHIPIFVEGRDEPVVNKTDHAHESKPHQHAPPPPQRNYRGCWHQTCPPIVPR